MNRCDVISKHYKQINIICRSLTNDWEDLSHDLCEYFLTCKADIVQIDSRGEFSLYVWGAAKNLASKYKRFDHVPVHQESQPENTIDTEEIIKRLDEVDLKILTIFASGVSFTEVSQRTKINRHTLSKHLKEAQANAKRIIRDL